MGKWIEFFCIFALFCVPQLFAGGIGIGSDSIELPLQELNLPAENSQNSAIGFYIAALLENSNMEKKVDLLLKAADLEPENRLILQVLMKAADRVPSRQKQVRNFLEQISQKFPANIFLAYLSCQMDARLKSPPETIIQKAYPVLKNTLPKKAADRRYFYLLATQYLDMLLSSNALSQLLPFDANKRCDLLELAILYYTSCRLQDMLLDRDFSLAQNQLDKHLNLLEQYRFEKFADVKRMAATLNAVKATGTAFRIVRTWNEKNFTPESALLLIETAARAGEENTLEQILKKYPALDVDFCIRMRCSALVRNGKYEQAAKMAENFQKPADRIQYIKWIALLKKDVRTFEKIIVREQQRLRNDRRQTINMLLSLAEMSREMRYFEQAEKLAQDTIEKDHTLANAFGYVAAVLEHNLDQAQKRIAFALRSLPDNPAYLDSMAWVCFKKGNFAEAEKYLQQALKKADFSISSAVLADHAGDIYFALMQNAKALRYYRTAQRLYLENPAENADLDMDALKVKIKNRFPEKVK